MGLTTTSTQNYGFLFSNREMSSEEKSAKATQSFLDAVRQANGSEKAEPTRRDRMAEIQETLNKIKNNFKLGGEEWQKFLKNLYEDGKLREDGYRLATVGNHLIPLGYTNSNGEFVKYDTLSVMSNRLGSATEGRGYDDWNGDPIEYLNNWIESLKNWKADMAAQSNKYDDFSAIDKQIDIVSKVLNELLAML